MIAGPVAATVALSMIVITILVLRHRRRRRGVRVTLFDDGSDIGSPVARAQDMAPPDYQLVFPPGSEEARLQAQANDAADASEAHPLAPSAPRKPFGLGWRLNKNEAATARPTESSASRPLPRAPVTAKRPRAR
jgi:hypothetical protein